MTSETPIMTFEQFQQTRTECEDLGAALEDSALEKQPGLLYCGALYIETNSATWANSAAEPFRYLLVIGRDEWLSNNLVDLERRLYQFALDELYCIAPAMSAETKAEQAAARTIAEQMRVIASAAMQINETLGAHERLNDSVPTNWPLNLSADEFAHECWGVAEHYDLLALSYL